MASAQGASKVPETSFPMSGKDELCVAITGGAGQIAYALVPLIVHGRVFGEGRKVRLRLLDIEACAGALEGVAMEIEDCFSELVGTVFSIFGHAVYRARQGFRRRGGLIGGPRDSRAPLTRTYGMGAKREGNSVHRILLTTYA